MKYLISQNSTPRIARPITLPTLLGVPNMQSSFFLFSCSCECCMDLSHTKITLYLLKMNQRGQKQKGYFENESEMATTELAPDSIMSTNSIMSIMSTISTSRMPCLQVSCVMMCCYNFGNAGL